MLKSKWIPRISFSFSGGRLIAFLYSSVGHAGRVGLHRNDDVIRTRTDSHPADCACPQYSGRPIGAFQFWRAGHFSWKLFWPFALLSIPALTLAVSATAGFDLRILIGLVLLFSAARLILRREDPPNVEPPSVPNAIGIGAGLGFLSGLTGTGGGIFSRRFCCFLPLGAYPSGCRRSALFILVNSIAGPLAILRRNAQSHRSVLFSQPPR